MCFFVCEYVCLAVTIVDCSVGGLVACLLGCVFVL